MAYDVLLKNGRVVDGSGMPIQDYQSYQRGKITSVYQELRLAGKWAGKGTWISCRGT